MNEGDRRLAAIAEAQFGVFARHQAAKAGLSEYAQTRRVMAGRWETMYPGVYRFPGTTRTGRQNAMAAVLWGGASSAISHATAARLLRVSTIPFDKLHLTVPTESGLRSTELVLHHTAWLK